VLALSTLHGIPARILGQQPAHVTADAGKKELQFQAAMAAENRGDLDQAEAILSTLHQAHPGIYAVDESLGLLIASRGDALRALPLLEAAVREQPSSGAAHANLGAAYYELHRNQMALAEFERAVRLDPRNLSAHKNLGRLALEMHRNAEAAKVFVTAQHLQPDDEDLKLDCVTALLAANLITEAQTMLATVADADHSARAQSLLGEVEESQRHFEAAGKHFDRAVQLEPSEENAWQLGYELLRHWTFSAAISEFEAAAAKFPASKRLRLGLGAALFGAKQYDHAIEVFADLLKEEAGNAALAAPLEIACAAQVQVVNPRCASLVAYAHAHPEDAQAATSAAAWLMLQSDDPQNVAAARKLEEGALAVDPTLPEAQFEMGIILQELQDWKGSIPYLERAVKLKPNYAQAHYRLARAYGRMGRKEEGLAHMELQRKYAKQQVEELDRRLNDLIVFDVKTHP
jgi:tetratricopeptide (TPR) repeat protein